MAEGEYDVETGIWRRRGVRGAEDEQEFIIPQAAPGGRGHA